jgi:predicted thioesterase
MTKARNAACTTHPIRTTHHRRENQPMTSTITAGLTATMDYRVPAERTVPHLLPEAPEFATMPDVLATGYLVGLVEWTCMQALTPHLPSHQRTLGVHIDDAHRKCSVLLGETAHR